MIHISDTIYALHARRNLIAFRTLRENRYHLMIGDDKGLEVLRLMKKDIHGMQCLETFSMFGNKLYTVHINPSIHRDLIVGANVITTMTSEEYTHWHARLGHIGNAVLRKMIKHQVVYDLPTQLEQGIIQFGKRLCPPCAMGKLVRQPFFYKEPVQSP
ncbi:hypothetical protein R1flu_026281 [Riccia fluitans]|uniref:GAG-pre-integrase domain-containing protein n=1 Tax=Riccia fluitans TaxID=41844 RepID=A0ABD1XJJ7_9MARC